MTLDSRDEDTLQALYQEAYAAFDNGGLEQAQALFARLADALPDEPHLHYMHGLASKYLRDWQASLQSNLRAQACAPSFDEASAWNAGIAATAAADWAEARRQWQRCGISIPDGEGPIDSDFGTACVRLNPWAEGETVFMRRLDPVRAQLVNVPLPDSGYRYGDIVLHDGASTGQRLYAGREVPVFNGLVRLQPSDMATFTAFVQCPSAEDMAELEGMALPGIGCVEDWTQTVRHLCLRCSYGTPHTHGQAPQQDGDDATWAPQRTLGIAAQGVAPVKKLLAAWVAAGRGRALESLEQREHSPSEPTGGQVWWRGEEAGDAAD